MVDQVNTGDQNASDSTAAPEGHDEAMAAKFDEAQNRAAEGGSEAPTEESGEEKILGKFNSVEDLAAAYTELEKKLGQGGNQEEDTNGKDEESNSGEEMSEEAEAAEKASEASLDIQSMSDYYAQHGSLSEEHYETLEKAGIPRTFVDQYIEGVQARAAQMEASIYESVGGQENYQQMTQWAAQNLPQDQIEAFNQAVDSNDLNQVRNAVQSLAYQYQQANPSEPSLVTNSQRGAAQGDVFESVAQLTAAMKDPRYESDPAYRRQIEQKLARSSVI